MDENGAQESHIDFYAQFDSLKPWAGVNILPF